MTDDQFLWASEFLPCRRSWHVKTHELFTFVSASSFSDCLETRHPLKKRTSSWAASVAFCLTFWWRQAALLWFCLAHPQVKSTNRLVEWDTFPKNFLCFSSWVSASSSCMMCSRAEVHGFIRYSRTLLGSWNVRNAQKNWAHSTAAWSDIFFDAFEVAWWKQCAHECVLERQKQGV